MRRVVVFLREARAELEEAVGWYESQRAGLGTRFTSEVVAKAQGAAEMPAIHKVVYKGLRAARVKRFPYILFFREEPTRIVIVSVFHRSREPKIWQSRA